MKREELKAYDGESIYSVLEYTPHNDDEFHLEECFNNKSEFKFYEKEEADKMMDAMEARIARLTKCVEMWKKANEDLQSNNTRLHKSILNSLKEIESMSAKNADLKKRIKQLEET